MLVIAQFQFTLAIGIIGIQKETPMTQNEIMNSIESLPADEQYTIASTILDRLVLSGQFTLSDAMREEIRRRDVEFEKNPNSGEPWESVKKEIFGE